MGDRIIPNIVVSVEALPKSGKSHFMLTFPDPMVVFSFDIGLEPVLRKFSSKNIKVITYPIPIIDTIRAVGFKKEIATIWGKFNDDFKKVTEDISVKTIGIDTGTAWYELCRIGRTGELGRELDPTEYGDVYLRLKAQLQRARVAGQNVVITHYLKDVYSDQKPTGEKVVDGWRHVEGEVDLVLLLRLERLSGKDKGDKIVATIKTSRWGLDLNGRELDNPTYEDIAAVLGILE